MLAEQQLSQLLEIKPLFSFADGFNIPVSIPILPIAKPDDINRKRKRDDQLTEDEEEKLIYSDPIITPEIKNKIIGIESVKEAIDGEEKVSLIDKMKRSKQYRRNQVILSDKMFEIDGANVYSKMEYANATFCSNNDIKVSFISENGHPCLRYARVIAFIEYPTGSIGTLILWYCQKSEIGRNLWDRFKRESRQISSSIHDMAMTVYPNGWKELFQTNVMEEISYTKIHSIVEVNFLEHMDDVENFYRLRKLFDTGTIYCRFSYCDEKFFHVDMRKSGEVTKEFVEKYLSEC